MLAARAMMLVLVASLAVEPARAEILIEDPAGDVGIVGLPLGVTGSAYDLREIMIQQQSDHLLVSIRIEGAPSAHDSAEFGVVFAGNGLWMAGYTALPYTNPAPHYRGGFACPATDDGFVNGSVASDCIGVDDWTYAADTYTIMVPLAFIQATNGTMISAAWGYSEVTPYLKGDSRVDVTSKHGSLVVGGETEPRPAPAVVDEKEQEEAPVGPVPTLVAVFASLLWRRAFPRAQVPDAR